MSCLPGSITDVSEIHGCHTSHEALRPHNLINLPQHVKQQLITQANIGATGAQLEQIIYNSTGGGVYGGFGGLGGGFSGFGGGFGGVGSGVTLPIPQQPQWQGMQVRNPADYNQYMAGVGAASQIFRGETFAGAMFSDQENAALTRNVDEITNPDDYKHMRYVAMSFAAVVFIIECIIGYFIFKVSYDEMLSDTQPEIQDKINKINTYQIVGIVLSVIVGIAIFKFLFTYERGTVLKDLAHHGQQHVGYVAAKQNPALMPRTMAERLEKEKREHDLAKAKANQRRENTEQTDRRRVRFGDLTARDMEVDDGGGNVGGR
jgi:hypothetical protein